MSERATSHKANAALSFHAVLCLAVPYTPACVTTSGSMYQREKESQHGHRNPWYCQVFPWSRECLTAFLLFPLMLVTL